MVGALEAPEQMINGSSDRANSNDILISLPLPSSNHQNIIEVVRGMA